MTDLQVSLSLAPILLCLLKRIFSNIALVVATDISLAKASHFRWSSLIMGYVNIRIL